MPTVIATPSNVNTKVRFQEQYVSAGLNQKTIGTIPNGIIRGGRLVTAGAGFAVQIEPDASTGDSVYTYTTPTGFQLTHREVGVRVLDLAAVASTTVYVCLYVQYAINAPTVVEWRTYSFAELFGGAPVAEAGSVVIVGRVDVPAAGPIPSTDVSFEQARFAWKDQAVGILPWYQIVENGDFEQGLGDVFGTRNMIPGYRGEEVNGALVAVESFPTVAPTRGEWHLTMRPNGTTGICRLGPGRFDVSERLSSGILPVLPGSLIDVSFWLAGDSVDTYTAGTSGVRLMIEFFGQSLGDLLVPQPMLASDPTVHVGSFASTKLSNIFEVPPATLNDGVFMRWWLEASIDGGAGAGAFFVDDVSVFVQPPSAEGRVPSLSKPSLRATSLEVQVQDGSDVFTSNERVATFFAESGTFDRVNLSIQRGEAIADIRWQNPFIVSLRDILDDYYGVLGTDLGAINDTTPTTYKLVHRYKASNDTDVRVYSSDDDGYVITVNARWEGAGTDLWFPDDSTFRAFKYSMTVSGLDVQSRDTPTGVSWNDASWTGGRITSDISGSMAVAGDYLYRDPSTRTRVTMLPLFGNFNGGAFALAGNGLQASAGSELFFPVRLPNGAEISQIRLLHTQSSAASDGIALFRNTPDMVTPAGVAYTLVGSASAAAAIGTFVTTVGGLSEVINNITSEYFVQYVAAGVNHTIHAIELTWEDPGPRNN